MTKETKVDARKLPKLTVKMTGPRRGKVYLDDRELPGVVSLSISPTGILAFAYEPSVTDDDEIELEDYYHMTFETAKPAPVKMKVGDRCPSCRCRAVAVVNGKRACVDCGGPR